MILLTTDRQTKFQSILKCTHFCRAQKPLISCVYCCFLSNLLAILRAGVRYRSRFSPIKNQTRSTWYDRTHERTNHRNVSQSVWSITRQCCPASKNPPKILYYPKSGQKTTTLLEENLEWNCTRFRLEFFLKSF